MILNTYFTQQFVASTSTPVWTRLRDFVSSTLSSKSTATIAGSDDILSPVGSAAETLSVYAAMYNKPVGDWFAC